MKHSVVGLRLVALLLGLTLTSGVAWAFPALTDKRSSCTDDNCRSIEVRGTFVHFRAENATKAVPAVYQLFTNGGECVRIEVIFQENDLDLEATLVCPDGTTWQNDDGAGSLRPLIEAITPSVSGWCTLHLASYDGEPGRGASFVGERHFRFQYGRYPSRNPNCSNPTVSLQGY